MPIKDLSNKGRIPRLGKIRLGVRTENSKGTEYPKAVDFFVCPPEVRAVYGDKPKKLNIFFVSDDVNEIFPQWYKKYGKSTGLVCKGDGVTALAVNPQTGTFEEVECTGRDCKYYGKDCRHVGNLYFMIKNVPRFGVYQLDTSSVNTILNINGGLEFAKNLTKGTLKLVPFVLSVVPQEVSPEGKKKTVYVLNLEADLNAMMASLNQTPDKILAIEEPVNSKAEIEEDLYPEKIVKSIKPLPSELKQLWISAQKKKITAAMLHKTMEEYFGIESSKDLDRKQFVALKKLIEKEIPIPQDLIKDSKEAEEEETNEAIEEVDIHI